MTTILEYIWLDVNNNFRSKVRIIYKPIDSLDDVPMWNYDSSSTGQASGFDSEIFLKPSFMCQDPFRRNLNSYLVWCEMIKPLTGIPLQNSNRTKALKIFNKNLELEPWFGIEQEYFIIDPKTKLPLGFTNSLVPSLQGIYYCGVGADSALGRHIVEEHMEHCLYSNIKICGTNGEVVPGQWEYQIGPCIGIEAGDHLWTSRWILNRVAESHGYNISYEPKILKDWNGSGLHTNVSTKPMREDGGIEHIDKAIIKLSYRHYEHMSLYGEGNKYRMTGHHETASGRGSRTVSVRIPNQVLMDGKGYFEDRRPGANADPYLVTSIIFETITSSSININIMPDSFGC